MKPIIAIDPGQNGGIASLDEDGIICAIKMPDTEGDLCAVLRSLIGPNVTAYVEEVGGYTGGKGAPGSAMFNFGRGFGFILGALAMASIPVVLVKPQKWQKHFGFGKKLKRITKKGKEVTDNTEWKNRLKAKAQQLYPASDVTLSTADALLILAYAKREEI